jgi:hypothetical protein
MGSNNKKSWLNKTEKRRLGSFVSFAKNDTLIGKQGISVNCIITSKQQQLEEINQKTMGIPHNKIYWHLNKTIQLLVEL